MYYKGFKIESIIHNIHPLRTKTLGDALLSNKYGTKPKLLFEDNNYKIWHKIVNGYYKYKGLSNYRLTYVAEYKHNNSGIETFINYKPNQTVPKNIEQELKKVLCQKIYEVYGIKLSKNNQGGSKNDIQPINQPNSRPKRKIL